MERVGVISPCLKPVVSISMDESAVETDDSESRPELGDVVGEDKTDDAEDDRDILVRCRGRLFSKKASVVLLETEDEEADSGVLLGVSGRLGSSGAGDAPVLFN